MNRTRFSVLIMAAAILVSSCSTSYQTSAGITGAYFGSRVGEAVGLLSGGFRGHNAALGSLVGMGIGAALGVSLASQVEKNEQKRYESARIANESQVQISDLTYTDANGDGLISRDEVCELEGFVYNPTNERKDNVVISVCIDGNSKDFVHSPSLTTSLNPGQRVRYTGRVVCRKARRGQVIRVGLSTSDAGKVNYSNYLSIPVR